MLYKIFLKPILFLFSPENAHAITLFLFRIIIKIPPARLLFCRLAKPKTSGTPISFCKLSFQNRIGLAAGFDKNGQYLDLMPALGFGFIELGTVTPRPQKGNDKPRLFRLPEDHALLNRMGFNNLGVEYLADQLKNFSRPNGLVIGGNIGKNKDTPNENAVDDYLFCFETLYSYVDYFVVNVSSPNTPGLRSLQEKEPLTHLLASLQRANTAKTIPKPILLKIAPDVSRGQIDDILEVISLTGCSGLVIANTTSGRDSLITDTRKVELFGAGGISGQPLKEKSNELISYVYEKTKGAIPIVGVGGVASVADALEKLKAGASLIQIYTGLVYEGPFLVRDLVDGTSS